MVVVRRGVKVDAMRSLLLAAAVVALGILASSAQADLPPPLRVETVIWQLSRDYPEGGLPDSALPIPTVYLKTHDGTTWMAEYDHHPMAIDGPARLKELMAVYAAQGIDVIAWFVPNGRDAEGQLSMAKEVLDAGVKGLYADVEPFAGFCAENCWYLAEAFWARLRAERPGAQLGVIYDPRPQWWDGEAASAWLAQADVALPMCFWETYSGQSPWDDPGGCVIQARRDLDQLAHGRAIEYAPVLQGDTSASRFAMAIHSANAMGARRASVWRRGVVPADVWDWLRAYPSAPTPCWVARRSGCLVREASSSDVYLLMGGGRFLVHDVEAVRTIGLDPAAIEVAPDGFLSLGPREPSDGTLLREVGAAPVWLVYGGARFWVPDPQTFEAMGFRWQDVVEIVPGMLDQVPLVPRPYTRLRELADPQEYVIVARKRVPLDDTMRQVLLAAGKGQTLYVVPPGALDQITPAGQPVAGDVTCEGTIDTLDALHILRRAADMSNLGLCAAQTGDVNCSGAIDATDALLILRYAAGFTVTTPQGCPRLGQDTIPMPHR